MNVFLIYLVLKIKKKKRLFPQCYRQWVYRAPLCITLRIKIWVVAYLKFIIFFPSIKKKKFDFILCNFLVRTLQCFQKKFKIFLLTKSWKNHPQKLLRKTQIHFFFLTASSAQMAQTEEFMFQNLAYRPTVYRTGVISWNQIYRKYKSSFRNNLNQLCKAKVNVVLWHYTKFH